MKSNEENDLKTKSDEFKLKFERHSYAIIHTDMRDILLSYYRDNNKSFYNKLISPKTKSEIKGNNQIYYDCTKVSITYVVDLFDLLKIVYKYSNKINKKDESMYNLMFRGHANANYLLNSSLLRNHKNIENEDEYYFDTIKSIPEAFKEARYHLDYLKTIQHYRGISRIMDIGTNVLIPIYFAVEKSEKEEQERNMGELIIFDKNNIGNIIEESKGKIDNNIETKRFNSDTVEILASLSALNKNLKDKIESDARTVIKQFKNKKGNYNLIEEFNKSEYVEKLVHEVGQVRLNFKSVIDPRHLFNIYFSDSTFDNERITNQSGEFIIHGFIDPVTLDNKLNKLRLKKSSKYQIFLITDTAKPIIREQLKMLKVMPSTVYPSLENTIKDIYNINN